MRFGLTLPGELPIDGQAFALVNFDEKGTYNGHGDLVDDPAKANVMTSLVFGSFLHKPIIDVDLPVRVVPSSTPGHHHLMIDKAMPWGDVVKLLAVMVEVGIVEAGYLGASVARGFTAVRLPWIKKGATA